MSHTRVIPKVKDCIAYIESCGWKLAYYNRPWYVFEAADGRRAPGGGKTIPFTLNELRQAFNNGW